VLGQGSDPRASYIMMEEMNALGDHKTAAQGRRRFDKAFWKRRSRITTLFRALGPQLDGGCVCTRRRRRRRDRILYRKLSRYSSASRCAPPALLTMGGRVEEKEMQSERFARSLRTLVLFSPR